MNPKNACKKLTRERYRIISALKLLTLVRYIDVHQADVTTDIGHRLVPGESAIGANNSGGARMPG